jgi:hypothetical protein
VFHNLVSGLERAGMATMDVVENTIYLTTDLSRFGLVDAAFEWEIAMTTLEWSSLCLGASVELDAIAARPTEKADG